MCESFFATLERELLDRERFANQAEARQEEKEGRPRRPALFIRGLPALAGAISRGAAG
jgi:DNA invertase Pin-like site-specific DNA recombinase